MSLTGPINHKRKDDPTPAIHRKRLKKRPDDRIRGTGWMRGSSSLTREEWCHSIGRSLSFLFPQVGRRDLIVLTRQFHTLVRSGVSPGETMDVLVRQTGGEYLRKAVDRVRKRMEEGRRLHMAFAAEPRIFSPLYCSILFAGEESDDLAPALHRLIDILEQEHRIISNIRAAFRYPIFILVTLVLAFFFLMLYVMPGFINVFSSRNIEMPLPTRICFLLYDGLTGYWPLVLAGALLSLGGALIAFSHPRSRFFLDRLALGLPILGPLTTYAVCARFAAILSLLHTSGVPVIRSLDILASVLGNRVIARDLRLARNMVAQGGAITDTLKRHVAFPPLLYHMIAVGERTGQLGEVLKDAADHYDTEVEYAVRRMGEMIGPVLILIMAMVVGFFALAMYLPMWEMGQLGV